MISQTTMIRAIASHSSVWLGDYKRYRNTLAELENQDISEVEDRYRELYGDFWNLSDGDRTGAAATLFDAGVQLSDKPHYLLQRLEYFRHASALSDANPHYNIEGKRAAYQAWADEWNGGQA